MAMFGLMFMTFGGFTFGAVATVGLGLLLPKLLSLVRVGLWSNEHASLVRGWPGYVVYTVLVQGLLPTWGCRCCLLMCVPWLMSVCGSNC